MKRRIFIPLVGILAVLAVVSVGIAVVTAGGTTPISDCADLPDHEALQGALASARAQDNGGFDLDMWGALVNRDGVVCAIAFTGGNRGDQWPGSRAISAQKANTANAFSLPGLALSTANLHAPTQPGSSLYGLQHSNPVDTDVAYRGPSSAYGQEDDPMVGGKIGGVNVFGGGLALYNDAGLIVGAVGVSGDSSCADHNIAWRTRSNLGFDYVPGGVSGDSQRPDNIVFIPGDFSHPHCLSGNTGNENSIAGALPSVQTP